MNKPENQKPHEGVFRMAESSTAEVPKNQINEGIKNEEMIKFNAPKNQSSIIKVIGVGGGGSNAVNHMFKLGIKDVDFIICNTDAQALANSPVPVKIQLGSSLTEGRGAGSLPEIGKKSAIENIEEIAEVLEKNTKMLFITAGMGGGTGTGAAPVIAAKAKELGILTVGIVTIPFGFEGRKRALQAKEGIKELRNNVDSLLIINNDKLRELYGNLELSKAFSEADSILTTAAKGIAEIITMAGYVNVDFEDVRTVMKESGVAIMGAATADGEERAITAVKKALESPLLNDNNIKGASDMLLYITSGEKEVLMDEISEITDYIQMEAGDTAEVIWGNGYDASLGDKISVTIIATGFETTNGVDYKPQEPKERNKEKAPEVTVHTLENIEQKEQNEEITSVNAELKIELKTPETAQFAEQTPKAKEEKEIIEKTEEGFTLFRKKHGNQQAEPHKTTEAKPHVFTLSNTEKVLNNLPEEKPAEKVHEVKESSEQVNRLDKNRQLYLKELSMTLKNKGNVAEFETEPAYVRSNLKMQDVPHSSETQVSRFTLSTEDAENSKPQLRQNNSYLHEKPD